MAKLKSTKPVAIATENVAISTTADPTETALLGLAQEQQRCDTLKAAVENNAKYKRFIASQKKVALLEQTAIEILEEGLEADSDLAGSTPTTEFKLSRKAKVRSVLNQASLRLELNKVATDEVPDPFFTLAKFGMGELDAYLTAAQRELCIKTEFSGKRNLKVTMLPGE